MRHFLFCTKFLLYSTIFLRFRPFCLLGVTLVSGCGSYSATFDCPKGEGLSCASLSEVNRHIDVGLLGGESEALEPLAGASDGLSVPQLAQSSKRDPSCGKGQRASDQDVGCCRSRTFLNPDETQVVFYYPPQRRPTGELIPGYWHQVRHGS